MVVSGSPKRWAYNPPIGRKNATHIYIYCLLVGYMPPTYHLLGEPASQPLKMRNKGWGISAPVDWRVLDSLLVGVLVTLGPPGSSLWMNAPKRTKTAHFELPVSDWLLECQWQHGNMSSQSRESIVTACNQKRPYVLVFQHKPYYSVLHPVFIMVIYMWVSPSKFQTLCRVSNLLKSRYHRGTKIH